MIGVSRSGSTKPRTNATDVVSAGVDRSIEPKRGRAETQGRMLIRTGIVGAGLAALCCATPILAVLLPAVGLGAWLAGADQVLLVLLVISLGVMALGLVRRQARTDSCCETQITKKRV